MKTYFHIENKEFTDYLKVTVQERKYYFCDDLMIEYDDCDALNVDIELIKPDEYLKFKAKNPFLRLLLNIVKWIFSPLIYFIDNDGVISLDNGFHSFNPFTYKKSFSITSPNEKTININFTQAKYDNIIKKYTNPLLELRGDGVIEKNEETTFSSAILKREWNTYHIPAFTVLMIIVLLLNVIGFLIFAKVIREIPLCSMSENISGIVGMSFCSLVMLALFVAYVVVIVKAHRRLRRCRLDEYFRTLRNFHRPRWHTSDDPRLHQRYVDHP